LLIFSSTFAQEPVAIHISEKYNLSDIEFYDVLEDKDGIIWFTADQGLSKHDGSSFVTFDNIEKKGHGVFGLFEDAKGRIWCNNLYGQFFYVSNDKMELFTSLESINEVRLINFAVFNETLIIVLANQIIWIDVKTKKQIRKVSTGSNIKPIILKDRLIICSTEKIYEVFSWGIKTIHAFKEERNYLLRSKLFLLKGSLFLIEAYNEHNELFIVEAKGIRRKGIPSELTSLDISNIYCNNSDIWFCTTSGLFSYNYSNGNFNKKYVALMGKHVSNVVVDRNDAIWLTTIRNGIFLLPNIRIRTITLPNNCSNISCLGTMDSSRICLGTTNGNIVTMNINTFHHKQIELPVRGTKKIYSLKYAPHLDRIYFGQVILKSLSIEDFSIRNESRFGGVKSISLSNRSLIYGSSNGSYLKEQYQVNSILKIDSSRCNCTYYSTSGSYYLGTINGLLVYDGEVSEKIKFEGREITALEITETEDKTIWVSTVTKGLLGIKKNKVVYQFEAKDGLISNKIGEIKGDNNFVWIASNKGLQVLNVKSQKFNSLTSNAGIISNAITGIELIGGRVFVSSNKGLVFFERNSVFKRWIPPNIYFTKVRVNDMDKKQLKEVYSLEYQQKKVEIFFSANGFYPKGEVVYQYRLLGQDSTWNTVNREVKKIKLLNLLPSSYVLEVRAKTNNDKVAFSGISRLKIRIEKPYWQQTWFFILLGVSIVSIFYLVIKIILKTKHRKQNLLLEKTLLDKENSLLELENLRSQMNPHFIFNALNSIQEYIVLNKKLHAQEYLVKFSKLIRLYLDQSQRRFISLSDEMESLNLYLELENLRFNEELDYKIKVNNDLNIDQIKVPSVFIQPYAENAIKHGLLHKKQDRKLRISFSRLIDTNELLCELVDNGIGRQASEIINKKNARYHNPFATFANKRRLQLLNRHMNKNAQVSTEDLYGNDGKSMGTKVSILIPIKSIEAW